MKRRKVRGGCWNGLGRKVAVEYHDVLVRNRSARTCYYARRIHRRGQEQDQQDCETRRKSTHRHSNPPKIGSPLTGLAAAVQNYFITLVGNCGLAHRSDVSCLTGRRNSQAPTCTLDGFLKVANRTARTIFCARWGCRCTSRIKA